MYGRPRVTRRRPLLRAAAVGGTFAAGRAAGRRAAEQAGPPAGQDQGMADRESRPGGQRGQPAPQDQGAGTGPLSAAEQLSQLAELHQRGALTDEEFATAKARILAG